MSERQRAKAVLAFYKAARAALEAGEPLEGLRAHLTRAAAESGKDSHGPLTRDDGSEFTPGQHLPPRFDRPGAGE
jgi:hypothetical protein